VGASRDVQGKPHLGQNTVDEKSAERQAHAEVAVSRMTLRSSVRAETVVPDLGRVSIEAHTRGDNVDLRLFADRADTGTLLRDARQELRADLGRAHLNVGEMSIDAGSGSATSSSPMSAGSSGSRSQQQGQHDTNRGRRDDASSVETVGREVATADSAGRSKRVRIVL
jgi:hypothetical protein